MDLSAKLSNGWCCHCAVRRTCLQRASSSVLPAQRAADMSCRGMCRTGHQLQAMMHSFDANPDWGSDESSKQLSLLRAQCNEPQMRICAGQMAHSLLFACAEHFLVDADGALSGTAVGLLVALHPTHCPDETGGHVLHCGGELMLHCCCIKVPKVWQSCLRIVGFDLSKGWRAAMLLGSTINIIIVVAFRYCAATLLAALFCLILL